MIKFIEKNLKILKKKNKNNIFKFIMKDIKGDIVLSSICDQRWIKLYKYEPSKYLKLLIAQSNNIKFKRLIKTDSSFKIITHKSKKNKEAFYVKIEPFGVNGVARYTMIIEEI